MFEWLRIVRVCDVQSIRWVLGALNSSSGPVSTRSAQVWCARMEQVGLIERANLGSAGGSWVWGTYEATGQARPRIYTQTARHEVAVAAASARFIAAGFAWKRDEKPSHVGGHQADGVALGVRSVDLIEVELTPKRAPRYASIFSAYRRRLTFGSEDSVVYLCTEGAARAVRRALSDFRSGDVVADRVRVRVMFNDRGGMLA